jgi:hypothetical protein
MKNDAAVDVFKTWLFPGLVAIVGMMIWSTLNEIKSDVKALMAQSNIDKTRIDNLERQVYKSTSSSQNPVALPDYDQTYAILPDNKLIKKWQSKNF